MYASVLRYCAFDDRLLEIMYSSLLFYQTKKFNIKNCKLFYRIIIKKIIIIYIYIVFFIIIIMYWLYL